jgi:hypothetical protein
MSVTIAALIRKDGREPGGGKPVDGFKAAMRDAMDSANAMYSRTGKFPWEITKKKAKMFRVPRRFRNKVTFAFGPGTWFMEYPT